MARRPRDSLLLGQSQRIIILAPRRDLLTLPLALAEMDSGKVRRGCCSLAILSDLNGLRR